MVHDVVFSFLVKAIEEPPVGGLQQIEQLVEALCNLVVVGLVADAGPLNLPRVGEIDHLGQGFEFHVGD